jgi:hypothetical protein
MAVSFTVPSDIPGLKVSSGEGGTQTWVWGDEETGGFEYGPLVEDLKGSTLRSALTAWATQKICSVKCKKSKVLARGKGLLGASWIASRRYNPAFEDISIMISNSKFKERDFFGKPAYLAYSLSTGALGYHGAVKLAKQIKLTKFKKPATP